MRAGGIGEPRRHELGAAADQLFEALYREDLAALVARFDSGARLRDAVVDRAGKVADKLAKTADPVTADEYIRLIAATLTWGRTHAGVHQNTRHATNKFSRYRSFPELPPEVLVRIGRADPGDDDRVIALLARSLRIRKGVTDARPAGEPTLLLNMIIPAIVTALGEAPGLPPDPAADTALIDTALGVLERGAQLAATYRAARRLTRGADTTLPVIGNTDFLVRIAAYHLAIKERRGFVAAQPLDELHHAVAELTGILRRSMTRATGRWGWRTPDEPDVATAIDQFAIYLGSSARDATTAGRRVNAVHRVLNHRLHLDDRPDDPPIPDPDGMGRPLPDPREPLSDVEHLISWLVAELFRGAGWDARQPLLAWLSGKPPKPEDLPLLVRRLRVAISELNKKLDKALDQVSTLRPPQPAGVTPGQFEALTARLAAASDPGDINGRTPTNAHCLALAALPPLWTRRQPAIQEIASHLRQRIKADPGEPDKAMLVAAYGVRTPMQFVEHSTKELPVPCCPDEGRPVPGGQPREPVGGAEVCPHRPWGEIGLVENYRSLGVAADFSAEAARKQLKRYQGPWSELLLWP